MSLYPLKHVTFVLFLDQKSIPEVNRSLPLTDDNQYISTS